MGQILIDSVDLPSLQISQVRTIPNGNTHVIFDHRRKGAGLFLAVLRFNTSALNGAWWTSLQFQPADNVVVSSAIYNRMKSYLTEIFMPLKKIEIIREDKQNK